MFQWKNGFDPDRDKNKRCRIFEFDCLLSLNSIVETLKNYGDLSLWEKEFIPLLTDTTGQYILFNNEKGDDYGRLQRV